jgi:hypothetical protein
MPLTVSSGVNRRGFLRALVGDVSRGVLEGSQPAPPPPPPSPPRSTPASATSRCASTAELRQIVEDAGLAARWAEVERLARQSVRLVATGNESVSPELPHAMGRPIWDGEELDLVLVIDREALPQETAVPFPRGRLFVFYAAGRRPSGLAIAHTGAAVIRFDPTSAGTPPECVAGTGRELRASAELQLPRVWSYAVSALGLTEVERDAWETVRFELAQLQGIQPEDATPGLRSLHRMLGYPDERRGDMPLACELLERGHDVEQLGPYAHPEARRLEDEAQRWKLLLQLTVDDAVGWDWGRAAQRLYFWLDQTALAAQDLSEVRAFVR